MTSHTHELSASSVDRNKRPSEITVYPQEMGRQAIGEVVRNNPSYKFVFCTHTVENSPAIAEALRDCDVLAFEGTGGSHEDRSTREQIYTDLLSSRLPEDAQQQAIEMLMTSGEEGAFMGGVLKDLHGTDKRVVLVDVEKSSSDYHLLEKMDATDNEFRTGIANNVLNNELKELMIKNITAWANASRAREAQVAQQLEELRREETGKIGVVMGATHTPIQHMLDRSGNDTDRVFIDAHIDPEANINEKAHYSYLNQAIRQLNLKPDSELEPSLVNRMLLHEMYYTYAFDQEPDSYTRERVSESIRVGVTEHMTDSEVDDLLEKLDSVKRAGKGRFINRKNSKIQLQVKALLDDNRRMVTDR